MGAVYSKRFLSSSTTTSTEASYVVPTGFIAVVRDLDGFISEPTGSGLTVQAGPDQAFLVYQGAPGTANFRVEWRGRQVLNPGEELIANLYGEGGVTSLLASGYLLTAGQ